MYTKHSNRRTKSTLVNLEPLIQEGLSKVNCAKRLGVCPATIDNHLEAEGTKWGDFKTNVLNGFTDEMELVNPDVEIDNDFKPVHEFTEISEDLYKSMLLNAAHQNPTDIRIITELRNYLDKTEKMKIEKGDLILSESDMEKLVFETEEIIPEIRGLLRGVDYEDI